jgi:azurin
VHKLLYKQNENIMNAQMNAQWFGILLYLLPVVACAAPQKVEVTVNDQIRYSAKTIDAKVGVPIEITLRHTGKIPKANMSHNMVILKPGSMVAMISARCVGAKDKNYVADDAETKAAVVVASPQLGPGESYVLRFTPTQAGEYPFLCTYPGHFGEMNGVIVVK